jgi:hypothetical protein
MTAELMTFKQRRSLVGLAAKPPAVFLPNDAEAERLLGFFTANHQNKNTRRANYRAACRFSDGARAGAFFKANCC